MPKAPPKHAGGKRPPSGSHPHVEAAEGYVEGVLSGAIPSCRWVRLACARHREDMHRAAWRYRFDAEKAERVCRFIELQGHVKGKWARERRTLKLEPWQCFKTISIFGWTDRRTGMRRYRRATILEPRKNAKSTWAAGVGLYMLAADNEAGAEVYSGATSEKQAYEVFGPARLMAQGQPDLRAHFGITVNVSNIHIAGNSSKFEPVIGKPGDGASPSCAIVDEFHEHATPDQYDTMLTGMGAREQPLLLAITTAGDNVAGPCYDAVLTGRKVLEGAIEDDELFYIEYTVDPEDDWTQPEALRKANPNMGVSIDEEFLLARQREAIRNPREQGRFKTKHLNLWINSRAAYFNMQRWAECRHTFSLDDLDGEDCILSLDLASKVDIAAVEIIFPRPDGSVIRHGLCYLPESTVTDPNNAHYGAWQISGDLVMTDGNITDYGRILDDILDLMARFNVLEVAYDPFQATMLVTELQNAGVPVIEYRPTVLSMSEPMKHLDALIISGRLQHDCGPSHPMTWMMSNVVAQPDAKDNVYPRKEKPELKIDGPVALIAAVGRMLATQNTGGSVYESRGLLVL